MAIPKKLYDNLKQEHTKGLFPVIEVELNGGVPFDKLLDTIHHHYQIPFKLIRADIEYLGKLNFGKMLLHLHGTTDQTDRTIRYLNENRVKNTLKGYA
ncbi:hypothetical protein H8S90_15400 [Olivibacter sp. SDN3]|uniref:NIL domain-containing protein n=1 Tax=Olivibacter sp. SDN3 TaxID=2764720 RepID=UPI0016513DA1|nr:NIL domain-containing protein [Olivibacter sp. SDN3]QNL48182.1 hypothetical protein H8S90_15400 [Olivibacter sp. SDN3]